MGAVVAIAVNDLRRRVRDRSALVIAFVAPFALAGIMGLAFGSGDSTAQVKVAVVDVDNTTVTKTFVDEVLASLSLGPSVSVARLNDLAAGSRLYNEHRVSAVVNVLPGSTARLSHGLTPVVNRLSSRTRPLGKAVVDGFVASTILREVTAGFAGPAAVHAPPAIGVADDALGRRGSPLGYFGPAMGIIFLFLSVGAAANSVLAERATGTMARLQASPAGLGSVVAGKTISIVGLMLISMLSLWGGTALAFGAHWGQPVAVLALIVATVVAIAALGLFVTVSARSEAMAQAAAAGLAFVLALVGGNFFPPGSLPPLLERLSLLTPNGWALDGFTTLSLDGGTLGDVVRPLAVLGVISVVVGAAAVARFQRAVAAV
jgi:ABC-2 type transport system permease protein